MFLFFLSSGLFLGWSLGANDAANIFGSAVGSKMVKFSVAVIIASIFVILGAVLQGAGASDTLGKLGSVNAIGGAFTVALCAGVTVFWMTRLKLPISTSQAIIGAIIGWNFYSGNTTDITVLGKIVSTWVAGPILGAIFAILLYLLLKFFLERSQIHLIKLDAYLKYALLIIGAFGAYSLGANNVANVVGVFIPSVPDIYLDFGFFALDGIQLLFLVGGISIAVGIVTYSKKVMMTVGSDLMKLSAEAALVIVLAHAMVLFIFSSSSLSNAIQSIGLPGIPLVPVSSSQAIVGAIMGVGLLKGGRGIKFNVLGRISLGWITTPIIAGFVSFVSLFFMDNVFKLQVFNGTNTALKSATTNLNNLPTSAETALNINLFQPLLYTIIIILIAVIIVLALKLTSDKLHSKDEQSTDIVRKYKTQEAFLKTELTKVNSENAELEKEIEFKRKEQMNIALSIIQKNRFLEKLRTKIDAIINKSDTNQEELSNLKKLIVENLSIDKERQRFNIYINELNRDFYFRLLNRYPNLTENEQHLCALVRLNLSSKDMASILNISTKSVEVNRHRLRKKMHLKRENNLSEIISKL
ncbi:inorganic phosphate transporter [Lutibacter sp. A80]|uniref:inorganic phosphate transporter n=1 Tax=Lutibacter sp. A80 TaxID=2918453 RepID=UPI001F05EC56|nr:inorganic phosphate transporter [Lutibacter sp. A80]UMB59867.1 inorganic phosphate transporter [Lutibacter sp. A80]